MQLPRRPSRERVSVPDRTRGTNDVTRPSYQVDTKRVEQLFSGTFRESGEEMLRRGYVVVPTEQEYSIGAPGIAALAGLLNATLT
jgi:hypothetical protein